MQSYTSKDIAIVVPTKDRPQSIRELLSSLAVQSAPPGRVIIVDSGVRLDSVITEFSGVLPIEYHRSAPSQIRQRKLGLSLLDESTPLVATIDDDIVFEPNAFAEVLEVMNSYGAALAGVGFNTRSSSENDISFFDRLFCMESLHPGVITSSGYNTSIANVTQNIHTSWLGGGYTVWKFSILRQYKQEELKTSWAVGEDVRLSYQIGKKHPLIVACKAYFREKQVFSTSSATFYKGLKAAAAFYYFVKRNPELSRLLCIWMLLGRALGSMLIGLRKRKVGYLNYGIGHFLVVAMIPGDFLKLFSIKRLLED